MKATDKDYLAQQQALLPSGFAWNREPDGWLGRILAGLAVVWARVHNRALALIGEADPSTAYELLPDWESVAGLPDDCTGETATTIQERRAALVSKLTDNDGPSVAFYEGLAQSLGYQIAIRQYRPFIAGIARCGASGDVLNGGHDVRFFWTVVPAGPRVTRFRCGASAPYNKLCKLTKAGDLECLIRRESPAHTEVIFDYKEM